MRNLLKLTYWAAQNRSLIGNVIGTSGSLSQEKCRIPTIHKDPIENLGMRKRLNLITRYTDCKLECLLIWGSGWRSFPFTQVPGAKATVRQRAMNSNSWTFSWQVQSCARWCSRSQPQQTNATCIHPGNCLTLHLDYSRQINKFHNNQATGGSNFPSS